MFERMVGFINCGQKSTKEKENSNFNPRISDLASQFVKSSASHICCMVVKLSVLSDMQLLHLSALTYGQRPLYLGCM